MPRAWGRRRRVERKLTVTRSHTDTSSQTQNESLRLLALAILCAVLTVALYVVFVRTGLGQRIDDAALDGRASLSARSINRADSLLQTVSVASVAILGGGIVLVAVMRARLVLAAAAAAVLVGANVTTQVLKATLSRPDLVRGQPEIDLGNSFPSGHTAVAASIAVAAVLVAPRRLRGAVAVAGLLYTVAIGVATLTAGWHRPSDAIAAVCVAVGWGSLAAWMIVVRRAPAQGAGPATPFVSRLLVVAGGAVCAVTFAALVAALVARRFGQLGAVDLGRAYATAAVSIAGAVALLFGLLLVALRPVTLDARQAER
jgi:membrane-associated phospholipid phosphatase